MFYCTKMMEHTNNMCHIGILFFMAAPLFHPNRKEIDLASVLVALGDPVRLKIVARLAENGESPCGALGIEMPKSTVSHHFKILREAGIVRVRLEGTSRHLSLRHDDLSARFPGLLEAVLRAGSA